MEDKVPFPNLEDPPPPNYEKEVRFIKTYAPFILIGAREVLLRYLKWGVTLFKVANWAATNCINDNNNQTSEPVREEPKRLPPPPAKTKPI
jgi:hypothetical protein